jgi:heme/copper-type cytochrome/quinol oxidase subunit 2
LHWTDGARAAPNNALEDRERKSAKWPITSGGKSSNLISRMSFVVVVVVVGIVVVVIFVVVVVVVVFDDAFSFIS